MQLRTVGLLLTVIASGLLPVLTSAGLVALAIGARLALDSLVDGRYPFLTFYPAITVAAWLGGLWPGLLVTAGSAASAAWMSPVPAGFSSVAALGDAVALAVFVFVGAIISGALESVHRAAARERAAGAQLQAARDEARAHGDAMQAAERRMSTLISSVPGVVWEAWGQPDTMKQRIDFVSAHVEEMLGYSIEEWLGTPNFWLTIVHPDDRDRAARTAATAFAQGATHLNDFRWVRKDGSAVWVEAYAIVIRDESGVPIGMRGVTLDVSARKQLEVAERRARKDAEEANRLKDRFLATVSHELRTPLNVVLGWTDMLLSGRVEDARRTSALKVIGANARRQAELVEELLDVSRMAAGRLDLRRDAIDPGDVLTTTLESVQPLASTAGLALTAAIESPLPRVHADAARLQQIFWNLLSNAVKFTPRGGAISVSARRLDGAVVIQVTDTGQGIAQDFLPFVFDPFRQGDHASAITQRGLGLGLAIVKQLAEAHDGHVHAASDGPGTGATFTVTLPVSSPAT